MEDLKSKDKPETPLPDEQSYNSIQEVKKDLPFSDELKDLSII